MDTTPIVHGMDWAQVLSVFAIVIANIGTVIGLYIHTDKKIDANRNETNEILAEGRKESNEILKSIRDDIREFHLGMRDFHGRLCKIEERGKK